MMDSSILASAEGGVLLGGKNRPICGAQLRLRQRQRILLPMLHHFSSRPHQELPFDEGLFSPLLVGFLGDCLVLPHPLVEIWHKTTGETGRHTWLFNHATNLFASFQLRDAEIPDFKSLKEAFKMLHQSMAGDFKVVRKDMDELQSIIDNLRNSKSLDDIFTTEKFEELRRVVSSCEVPIRRFDDLLSTLREWKMELSELDLAPFMHGTGEEPFACIFTTCTQETPLKVFRSPGNLLWHLYHSHGLNIEPVGKPKHPGFWETILLKRDDWETNWRLGWDEKKRLVDEMLTDSIDWERINSLQSTCETSIAESVGRKPSLDNLRCSLLLSIRGNEFGLTTRLKALVLKMYLGTSVYEPCCPSGSEIFYVLTDLAKY
jgi:hypothetical protein